MLVLALLGLLFFRNYWRCFADIFAGLSTELSNVDAAVSGGGLRRCESVFFFDG